MCTDTCGEEDVESPVAEVKAVVSSLPGCEERNVGSLDAQQALSNQYPSALPGYRCFYKALWLIQEDGNHCTEGKGIEQGDIHLLFRGLYLRFGMSGGQSQGDK